VRRRYWVRPRFRVQRYRVRRRYRAQRRFLVSGWETCRRTCRTRRGSGGRGRWSFARA